MALSLLLLAVTAVLVIIQLFFYLFVFIRLSWHKNTERRGDLPPVTVLVCAWNELENLKELLPRLDSQNYPEYEVIVLDDRSWDGTNDYLEAQAAHWHHIRHIRIGEAHDYITPKKYAITIGMKHALYPVMLMTDADCRPAGDNWIGAMVSQLSGDKEIVLGYSPYFPGSGLLNWFIRCETFYAAVQYMSLARVGLAYMGVGRNLMYRKDLFFNKKGFYNHKNVTGGDDDLFINETATAANVAINPDPESFSWSIPKTTWKSWFVQKKRHLSVSKYYRPRNKALLGIISFSHVGVWLAALSFLGYFLYSGQYQNAEYLGIGFGIKSLIQVLVLGFVNRRLGSTLPWYTLVFVDFVFFVYYLIMGFVMLFNRERRPRWR